jgi:phosphoesterase RecJ-like protein
MSITKVLGAIERGRRFLISSHINLEGDSLGSEIAMSFFLKKMHKPHFICNTSPVPSVYGFLPSLEKVVTSPVRVPVFDTAIILDCSDLERIGKVKQWIKPDKVIINIDHHMDNKHFGTVNWVNPKGSATGEMLYELFDKAGIGLDENTALCLYVAILTDTGGFRYENTTSLTHAVVSRLLELGIKPPIIFEKIYESHRLARMKLLGLALSNLRLSPDNSIAWFVVSQEMLKKVGADLQDVEGFIELARAVRDVRVAIFFQELKDNRIKIGFRSKGRINVSKIAHSFGGGGHFAASGCILKGKLKEIERMVLERVEAALR